MILIQPSVDSVDGETSRSPLPVCGLVPPPRVFGPLRMGAMDDGHDGGAAHASQRKRAANLTCTIARFFVTTGALEGRKQARGRAVAEPSEPRASGFLDVHAFRGDGGPIHAAARRGRTCAGFHVAACSGRSHRRAGLTLTLLAVERRHRETGGHSKRQGQDERCGRLCSV